MLSVNMNDFILVKWYFSTPCYSTETFFQGLTSHGVSIRSVENSQLSNKPEAAAGTPPPSAGSTAKSSELGIGIVKPKIPEIGSRLSRKFKVKTISKEQPSPAKKVRFRVDSTNDEAVDEDESEDDHYHVQEESKIETFTALSVNRDFCANEVQGNDIKEVLEPDYFNQSFLGEAATYEVIEQAPSEQQLSKQQPPPQLNKLSSIFNKAFSSDDNANAPSLTNNNQKALSKFKTLFSSKDKAVYDIEVKPREEESADLEDFVLTHISNQSQLPQIDTETRVEENTFFSLQDKELVAQDEAIDHVNFDQIEAVSELIEDSPDEKFRIFDDDFDVADFTKELSQETQQEKHCEATEEVVDEVVIETEHFEKDIESDIFAEEKIVDNLQPQPQIEQVTFENQDFNKDLELVADEEVIVDEHGIQIDQVEFEGLKFDHEFEDDFRFNDAAVHIKFEENDDLEHETEVKETGFKYVPKQGALKLRARQSSSGSDKSVQSFNEPNQAQQPSKKRSLKLKPFFKSIKSKSSGLNSKSLSLSDISPGFAASSSAKKSPSLSSFDDDKRFYKKNGTLDIKAVISEQLDVVDKIAQDEVGDSPPMLPKNQDNKKSKSKKANSVESVNKKQKPLLARAFHKTQKASVWSKVYLKLHTYWAVLLKNDQHKLLVGHDQ